MGGTWRPPAPLVAAPSSPHEPPSFPSHLVRRGSGLGENAQNGAKIRGRARARDRTTAHRSAHPIPLWKWFLRICALPLRGTRGWGAAEKASNDKIRNWCVQRRGVPPRAVWWRSCAKDYLETAYAPLSVLSAPHRTLQPAHASPLAASDYLGLSVPDQIEDMESRFCVPNVMK